MTQAGNHRPLRRPGAPPKPRHRKLKPRRIPELVIDHEALHVYLWERSDGNHLVRIHQAKLAEALGVSPSTVANTLAKFCESGKALRVRFEKMGIGIYQIADPAAWRKSKESTWADGKVRRQIQWG